MREVGALEHKVSNRQRIVDTFNKDYLTICGCAVEVSFHIDVKIGKQNPHSPV